VVPASAVRRLAPHAARRRLPPMVVAPRLLMACAPRLRECGPRLRVFMRRLESSAAMPPRGPSLRRAVRASRATCRRGVPLGVSFRALVTTRSSVNPGKRLMLS
jgi:hypothetical protein